MTKRKENPNRHMGKRTGYELVDGVYHIAPLYAEQFSRINSRRKGIEDMLAAVTREASKSLEALSLEGTKVWADIIDDLGLDKTTLWNYVNGTVKKQE